METYYKVTYKDGEGKELTQTRDNVERGYYLYKSLMKESGYNIKLEEISANGIALLRAEGEYKPIEVETREVEEKTEEKTEQSTDWFEMVFGVSRKEYNESLAKWNRLTGENNPYL